MRLGARRRSTRRRRRRASSRRGALCSASSATTSSSAATCTRCGLTLLYLGSQHRASSRARCRDVWRVCTSGPAVPSIHVDGACHGNGRRTCVPPRCLVALPVTAAMRFLHEPRMLPAPAFADTHSGARARADAREGAVCGTAPQCRPRRPPRRPRRTGRAGRAGVPEPRRGAHGGPGAQDVQDAQEFLNSAAAPTACRPRTTRRSS